jgi:tetratricopeptide (TPR) repeat protein
MIYLQHILFALFGFLLVACSGPGIPQEALEPYLEGKRRYIQGDLESSRQILLAVHQQTPDFSQNSYLLGKACYFLGEYEEAAAVWRETLDRNPHHIDSRKWLARLHLRQEAADSAAGIIEKALADSSEDPELLILLARARRTAGDYGAAIQLYRRVQLFERELAEARIELAEIYQRFGLREKALPELERAEKLLDQDSPLRPALQSLLGTLRGDIP